MKTILIYKRSILERTGFKKWPYREVDQITILYKGEEIKNHYESINNPRLKIKFQEVLKTRSKKALENYINKLSNRDVDKWQKSVLKEILENE